MNSKHQTPLLENIAAFASELHLHARYREFSSAYGHRLEGITGMWNFNIMAGQVFTAVERKLKTQESDIWIDAVIDYAELVITAALEDEWQSINSWDFLQPLAEQAITRASQPAERVGFKLVPK